VGEGVGGSREIDTVGELDGEAKGVSETIFVDVGGNGDGEDEEEGVIVPDLVTMVVREGVEVVDWQVEAEGVCVGLMVPATPTPMPLIEGVKVLVTLEEEEGETMRVAVIVGEVVNTREAVGCDEEEDHKETVGGKLRLPLCVGEEKIDKVDLASGEPVTPEKCEGLPVLLAQMPGEKVNKTVKEEEADAVRDSEVRGVGVG